MTKAKIILITLIFLAAGAGVFAFESTRFTLASRFFEPNGIPHTYYTTVNGRTYKTVLIECPQVNKWPTTTNNPGVVWTTQQELVPFYNTTSMPPFTLTTFVLMNICHDTNQNYTTIEP